VCVFSVVLSCVCLCVYVCVYVCVCVWCVVNVCCGVCKVSKFIHPTQRLYNVPNSTRNIISIIHDGKTKKGYCFNWHEGEAGRGTNEMVQVKVDFLKMHPQYSNFIFWEDHCGGQNQSQQNVCGDLFCVQNGLANSITTKFFVSGHSFMSPDQIGGTINQRLSKSKKIETPDDAFDSMKTARKNPSPLECVRMKEWFNWKELTKRTIRVLGT